MHSRCCFNCRFCSTCSLQTRSILQNKCFEHSYLGSTLPNWLLALLSVWTNIIYKASRSWCSIWWFQLCTRILLIFSMDALNITLYLLLLTCSMWISSVQWFSLKRMSAKLKIHGRAARRLLNFKTSLLICIAKNDQPKTAYVSVGLQPLPWASWNKTGPYFSCTPWLIYSQNTW